jgi:hypothetical protein
MNNKVDRIEFSQIIQNKANSVEVQKLMQELIRAKSFDEFQKNDMMQNILNDTASSHQDVDYDITRSCGRSTTKSRDGYNHIDVSYHQINLN